jgi:hypothetical protein
MGRAEKFYKYNSFSRDISFTFRVAATSEANLEDNYIKLRTLAASLAPTYTSQGYMAGNLHRLTFGNYVKGQYGILESVDYTIMDESPWKPKKIINSHFILKLVVNSPLSIILDQNHS